MVGNSNWQWLLVFGFLVVGDNTNYRLRRNHKKNTKFIKHTILVSPPGFSCRCCHRQAYLLPTIHNSRTVAVVGDNTNYCNSYYFKTNSSTNIHPSAPAAGNPSGTFW